MKPIIILIVALVIVSSFALPNIFAEKMIINAEGGLDVEITYPDITFPERKFPVSIFLKNNGWESKNNITLAIPQESEFRSISQGIPVIDTISAGGTYGQVIDFQVPKNISDGVHFVNIAYSQVLMKDNKEAQPPTHRNIAIPIKIQDKPNVVIHTVTPESIFSNAEFPFEIEIKSSDVDIRNVNVEILVPKDIDFRGETKHTFSIIAKNEPATISSRIITPQKEVNTEYKTPFQINVKYTDDIGNEQEYSQIVQMTLRPRTFMEITTDGGIWIGNVFLAPYVSIGTIIGIPAGTLFSLLIRRKQNKKKSRKK